MRGWTQAELARRAGIKAAQVAHFECGIRHPSLGNLCKLSDALQVSVDALIGREMQVPIPIAAGPEVQTLLELAGQLRGGDLELLVEVAKLLLQRRSQT